MAEIKLFRVRDMVTQELYGYFAHLEKELQKLFEDNLESLLGVRLLAHEYATGKQHPGQIDTLGLDENNCPVIIEFKRRNNENIITQGLYYLDWLLGHQAEFTQLARESLGRESEIEFASTRVICVASAFNRFDEKAVRQIGRNIELVRYRFYAEDLFLLELLYRPAPPTVTRSAETEGVINPGMPPAMQQRIANMNDSTEDLYFQLLAFCESLGEDVAIRYMKHYIVFARLKNFLSVCPNRNFIKIWLNLNPDEIDLSDGFFRDMRQIGHHSSGHLEADLQTADDLEKIKPFIEKSYKFN